jgi:RNA polymerase sigma-70 factor (ECF subfamily)
MLLGFATTLPPPRKAPPPRAPALDGVLAREVAEALPSVRVVIASVLAVGRDHADVDDGASETLRRAIEGHARLRAGEPVRPWLIGIARHVALDARRARGRAMRRRGGGVDDASGPATELPSPKPDPFDQLATARRDARVRDAVSRLPAGSRQALTLFHLDGLGYDAVAARLGVPMGTVATWISRGRKALHDMLKDEGDAP